MSDYISRDSVINRVLELAKEPSIQKCPDTVNGLLGAYNILYEFPSADVRENIKGEWIEKEEHGTFWVVCNKCNKQHAFSTNFCPNCGADMRGGE
jgi:hypothetical protein